MPNENHSPEFVSNDQRTCAARLVTRFFAVVITLTAMGMGAVAAWDRGGTAIDRVLLVAISICIIAAAHLLPALSRRHITWLLWMGCLACAIYGHLCFFTYASQRAGEIRAESSSQLTAVRQHIQLTRETLSGIRARPVATVAFALVRAKDEQRREVLKVELGEARRAAALRDELVKATEKAFTYRESWSTDPVTARVAAVTDNTENSIGLTTSLTYAVLLELIGTLLWWEVFRGAKSATTPPSLPSGGGDVIADLRTAVATGECRPTVACIRAYLGCSQARAIEVRRRLSARGGPARLDRIFCLLSGNLADNAYAALGSAGRLSK